MSTASTWTTPTDERRADVLGKAETILRRQAVEAAAPGRTPSIGGATLGGYRLQGRGPPGTGAHDAACTHVSSEARTALTNRPGGSLKKSAVLITVVLVVAAWLGWRADNDEPKTQGQQQLQQKQDDLTYTSTAPLLEPYATIVNLAP
jgi:hypothetical protein